VDEPVWLIRIVLEAIHANQVREHGGQPRLRDETALESVLARPRNRLGYEPQANLAELTAEYAFGLAKNHPSVDGSKRLAFAATNVFLILNGFEIEASEPEVVETMVALADGRMDREEFASWIRTALVQYRATAG
jgi:death on curing protein